MTIEEFEAYVTGLGLKVEPLTGADGQAYTLVLGIRIPTGALKGKRRDIAIQRSSSVPFIPPAAIHSRPALVPMGTHSSQASGIGLDWQYLSRRFDRPVSAKGLWTHILTVLGEVA